MDFSWNEDQLALREATIRFAQRELKDDLIERDRRGEFSWENWRQCAEFGIQGLPVPEEYGGRGLDILTTILVMEALGYGCKDNGLIFALNAQLWSVVMPILNFGTEAQKQKYLPRLIRGEIIGMHGVTEPGSGSDAMSLRTTAERRQDTYVLNGAKTFITSAPLGDLAVVFATVDRAKKFMGVTAFLVDKGTPGFSVSRDLEKMGLRTSPMGEVVLENCEIPVENRLGPEGAGVSIFNSSMGWERSCILASAIGTMERQLEECIKYVKERKQFGQPIGRFQAVAHKITDMKVRLESARYLVYRAGWLAKVGKPAILEAAIAKLYLSECFVQSSLDAIQLHGAYGYMTEFEIERDLRDALGGRIYSGTSEIQKTIIARMLGL
ncbi:MAG: acyl-CoA dehydrogenase family protein [Candidatus Rokubacteria bacterium]|nr:acyl-CoA dehydrogenase family protein [Candidatus Rokubacteria bacterium]